MQNLHFAITFSAGFITPDDGIENYIDYGYYTVHNINAQQKCPPPPGNLAACIVFIKQYIIKIKGITCK
jgi:hypothetical protein